MEENKKKENFENSEKQNLWNTMTIQEAGNVLRKCGIPEEYVEMLVEGLMVEQDLESMDQVRLEFIINNESQNSLSIIMSCLNEKDFHQC